MRAHECENPCGVQAAAHGGGRRFRGYVRAVKVEKEGRRETAKLHRGIWSLGSRSTQAGELLKKCYKEISPGNSCEFRSFGVSCSGKDCSAT